MDPRAFPAKLLALLLCFTVLAAALPASGWAMLLPNNDAVREADSARVLTALESRAVAQRLTDLGLSADEAMTKVQALSDEQLHRLASDLDSVEAGGDGVGAVIGLLLIAIIVVIVLQATGHEIIFKN